MLSFTEHRMEWDGAINIADEFNMKAPETRVGPGGCDQMVAAKSRRRKNVFTLLGQNRVAYRKSTS